MATTPVFQMGQESSASLLNSTLGGIQAQGTSILNTLENIQLSVLVDFDRALTALNGRQQRAARVQAPNIVALFVISDFDDIDQGTTTATIRADTTSATLRERSSPSEVSVSTSSFSSSAGTVEEIDTQGLLYSVFSSTVPTGTFLVTLAAVVDITMLTIDISAMASSPTIQVLVSQDGLTYTAATSVTVSGYRMNAWLPNTPTKYVQVVITPSHPDNLGGNTYTFGLTDFSGTTVEYNLVSDVIFQAINYSPTSATAQLIADAVAGLTYYLQLDNGSGTATFQAVAPGAPVSVPGVTETSTSNVTLTSGGQFNITLPANVYPGTVQVTDQTSGNDIPVVVGLAVNDPHASTLSAPHVALNGEVLTLLPASLPKTDQYTVSYVAGPASIAATLMVHLSTSDRTITPIFSGASLEEL